MNPKSFLTILVPLASVVILLLAPTVDSCVNFQAWWDAASGPDSSKISAQLWDDSANPICTADHVYVDSDGSNPYLTLTCIDGYSAVFDTINSWDLSYNTPHGPYVFDADYDGEGSYKWSACAFCASASDCFVPTNN